MICAQDHAPGAACLGCLRALVAECEIESVGRRRAPRKLVSAGSRIAGVAKNYGAETAQEAVGR